ncbi:hypothetical protein SLEP1_g49629 [Rubroshorea leprosula]|uniref:Uncharacterized protein n=1 Tax=Rubroshorea leprosula TaxID=152421 RepID=A0AAV5M0P2_9ROSI|nr:hypothetical protein SLEP1_g49629 [Rubroshorea leprosula]
MAKFPVNKFNFSPAPGFLEPRRGSRNQANLAQHAWVRWNPSVGSSNPGPRFEEHKRRFLKPKPWVPNPVPGLESNLPGFFLLFLCWLQSCLAILEWDLEFCMASDCLNFKI